VIAPATAVAEDPPAYGGGSRKDGAGGSARLGRRGEEAAARWLEGRGMRILARCFRVRGGEIDLVARDGSTLVFIEVKSRSGLSFGRPSEAVDRRKRARLVRAATLYLLAHGGEERPCRFDVVEVLADPSGRLSVRHLRDAFGAP
jgi:putative endonuclease